MFNKKRVLQKRLIKNECYSCARKLPNKVKICPYCGTAQLKECQQCHMNTYVAGEYCIHCGKK